ALETRGRDIVLDADGQGGNRLVGLCVVIRVVVFPGECLAHTGRAFLAPAILQEASGRCAAAFAVEGLLRANSHASPALAAPSKWRAAGVALECAAECFFRAVADALRDCGDAVIAALQRLGGELEAPHGEIAHGR